MLKIALSFDDGRKDNVSAFDSILMPLRIPVTLNITTDYIQRRSVNEIPCKNLPMEKNDVIRLSNNPLVEIAGHGKLHNNEIDNLLAGVEELNEWCSLDEIGIASPHSKLTAKEIEKNKNKLLGNKVKYIRVGCRIRKGVIFTRCIRKINSYIHSPEIFSWVYRDTLMEKDDEFILYSIPVLKSTTLKEVKYLIDNAASDNEKSLILMFHSILSREENFYSDTWSWDYNDFYSLCRYLKNKEEKKEILLCKSRELIH